jgi:uncharacterized membrane protein YeaQ/YmgE (transglycosylase-associated protein family)
VDFIIGIIERSIDFILAIIVGIFSGWLAGKIWKGKGFGLIGDLVVGILGGIAGNFIFALFGKEAVSLFGHIIASVVCALALLWLLRLIRKLRNI